MSETIRLGEIRRRTRKDIKHVHLSVHPPLGRVTLVAPKDTRPEVAAPTQSPSSVGSESTGQAARAGAGDAPAVYHA